MKQKNLNAFLLFCGSCLTLVVGLIAAYNPGVAYVTVHSYHLDASVNPYGLPYVSYPSMDFNTHIFTLKYLVCAVGGLVGLLALFKRNTHSDLGVFAIAVTSVGLMLPATGDTRLTFPEMRLFDVAWIGSFLVVMGLSLMFMGLMTEKKVGPRVSILSVPLLLTVYSINPLLVLVNYLPWIVFGASISPINVLMLFLMLIGHLVMIWGIFKSVRMTNAKIIGSQFQL